MPLCTKRRCFPPPRGARLERYGSPPYSAHDADMGLAAERNCDLGGNVDAAVNADGVEFCIEAVSGHKRLLECIGHTSWSVLTMP